MTGIAPSGAQDALNGLVGVTASVTTYLALLTSDPTGLSAISQLSEVTTSGYARQAMTWGAPTNASPSVIANTNIVTYTMSANMALPAQWAALVTSSSGTSGTLKYTWTLDEQEQVLATQSVTIPAGALTITQM